MIETLSVTVEKVTKKTESTKVEDPAGGRIRKTTWTYKLTNDLGDVVVTVKADRDLRLGEDDHVDVELKQRTWQAPLPKDDGDVLRIPDGQLSVDFPAKVRAAVRPGLEKIHAEAKAGKHGPMLKAAADSKPVADLIQRNTEAEAEQRKRGTSKPKPKKRRGGG